MYTVKKCRSKYERQKPDAAIARAPDESGCCRAEFQDEYPENERSDDATDDNDTLHGSMQFTMTLNVIEWVMLRRNIHLYFELEHAARCVGEHDGPLDHPDAGRTVRVRVIHNTDRTALACFDEFVRRRYITMAAHAERPFDASVRLDDKGRRAHA